MTTDTLLKFQDPLWGVLLRLAIDVAVLYIIIYLIYYRFSNKKDFMFPLFLMGIMLFLICILLRKSEMQMGMALGLFAVFSIMRFRTENLAIQEYGISVHSNRGISYQCICLIFHIRSGEPSWSI